MEVSEQLTGFELEDLKFWTVSNLQRLKRQAGEDLSGLIFL